MKIIIIIIGLIMSFSCKSQIISSVDYANNDDIDVPVGAFIKDTENKMNSFIGTWKWVNGNSSFTIVFSKLENVYYDLDQYYSDHLIGKYQYIENGVEIVNTLNYNGINAGNFFSSNGFPYVISDLGYAEDAFQDLSFFDELKNKRCNASIELLNTLIDPGTGNISASEMQWKLWSKERVVLTTQSPNVSAFSIPEDVILIKQ